MQKYAAIILSTFGFVLGSEYIVHNLTGFLFVASYPDYYFGGLIHLSVFIGLIVSGILVIKEKPIGKYIALVSSLAWMYYAFDPITWPINNPRYYERLGITGWEAWKRTIDIGSIAIIRSILLLVSTSILFIKRFNKSSKPTPKSGDV